MATLWPPPTGSPAGTSGWYRASDGRWYRTDTAPAPGWGLGADGRWAPGVGGDWRSSRWGIGDAWWGLLVYIVASLGLSGAVAAFVVATGGDLDDLELGPYAVSFLVVGNVLAFAGVPWLATRRKGLRSLRDDFGLRLRPVDLAIGLGFGVGGLVVAGIVGTLIDAGFDTDETTSNIPVDTLGGPAEVIVFALSVAILTPVIEELFFRGLVYRSLLKRRASTPAAIVWTTIVFVVPHLTAADDVASLVSLTASLTVLGLSFQLACHVTRGRLGAPIVAHAVVNGSAVLALALA
ncbi:MAG: CPBP family intramembrane glutamic endopeptidase [Acidimicrobiia bacterium]